MNEDGFNVMERNYLYYQPSERQFGVVLASIYTQLAYTHTVSIFLHPTSPTSQNNPRKYLSLFCFIRIPKEMVAQNVINSISLAFLHSIRQFARHDDG